MGQVTFRLVVQHDYTYAVQLRMADGKRTVIKDFAREAEAEAWIEEQKRKAPEGEVWERLPLKNWQS